MKWIFSLTLTLLISHGYAQENSNPFDVQVSVAQIEGRFQIQASYSIPMNICNAFAFITDYEGAKNIPGILEAKIISRAGNKVRVYRVIEEQALYFPIEMKSVMEYIETPYRGLSFEQISGDMKSYKGSWRLTSDKGKTDFKYEAWVEPDSIIPSAVIEYFMKNSSRGRFELMAQRASQHKAVEKLACK
jgi:Polyketide cyclase / dehydrase and lipid transport